jgi:hypothetical protein
MVFSLFRVAMDFVENIRVSEERTEAGLGAEVEGPAAVWSARKIGWIGVTKDAPAEGDELR